MNFLGALAGGSGGAGKSMEIRETAEGVVFTVRVTPRASRDAIEGEFGGALRVRVTAPPVEDRANEAVRRLLAARLNVALSAVRIVAGEKSRVKRVAIARVSRGEIAALLGTPGKAADLRG